MFTSGGPRQYPELARYLTQELKRIETPTSLQWIRGWFVLSGGLTVGAIINAAAANGNAVAAMVTAALAAGMAGFWMLRTRKIETPDPIEVDARPVKLGLHKSLFEKRLELDLAPGVAALLEECARLWLRVDAALRASPWSGDRLPAHYVRARDQARAAADQAMNEIMITIGPTFNPNERTRDWRDMAEDVLTKVLGKEPLRTGEPLPPEYVYARELAEKLRTLAQEVESARSEIGEVQAAPRAEHSLDAALGEIRAIKEAEDELRQNLRN